MDTRHCHFTCQYHRSTNTLVLWTLSLFHYCNTSALSLFWHVLVPTLHGYSRTRDTVIAHGYMFYWTLLLHVIADIWHGSCIVHRLTGIHALIVIFLSCGSPFLLHGLLLHVHSCHPVTWLFPLLVLIFSLLNIWAIDTWCVKLSDMWIQATMAASRISRLLYIVFRSLISWYQQSSCPIIVLLVPCTVLVLDILCCSNIIHITWGWGRLDSWLGLIGGYLDPLLVTLQTW